MQNVKRLASKQGHRRTLPRRVGAILLLGLATFGWIAAEAGQIRLNNGTIIRGTPVDMPGLSLGTARENNAGPVPQTPIYMVDDGMRRYFVSRRQVPRDPDAIIIAEELSSVVTYTLPPPILQRQTHTPASVGEFAEVSPFDVHGRRYVTLRTRHGTEEILQSIVEIRPDFVQIKSTSHDWTYGVSTSTIPSDTLREIIAGTIDENDPDERMALVSFFIQAEMYPEARRELDAISEEFSELRSQAFEAMELLTEANAERGLNEIRRRREAGQHSLAYYVGSQYPQDGVPPDLYRQARDIVAEYDTAVEQKADVERLLDELQARVSPEYADRLPPMRDVVREELYFENIARLEPFLRIAEDESLPVDDRLALAYSGWLLGAANAVTSMPAAISVWDARFLAIEYLRQHDNPIRREAILEELRQLEEFDHSLLVTMIPQLPLAIESPPLPPGMPTPIEVVDMRQEPIAQYTAMVPTEYSTQHSYPLLVVLRAEGRTTEQMVSFWGGTAEQPGYAQRFGYIVIAPEYASAEEGEYAYGPAAHQAVVESIQDARKRFRIDSNRVFLVGHGMGGTACFDMGLSHPDLFAGVVPINGFCEKICRPYYENAPSLAWYVVNGERYLGGIERNADVINDMLRGGQDLIYCEYKERGFESYAEELPRIFEWMSRFRRDPWQREVEVNIVRSTDNHFYWTRFGGFPTDRFPAIDWSAERPTMPRRGEVSARIVPEGNSVHVEHPGRSTTIWLSPDLIDFTRPVKINANHDQIFNGLLEPSMEATLEDLRIRGDREMLFHVRVDAP
jgi:pimeloyl-ACP methyl ester carboxylesterase